MKSVFALVLGVFTFIAAAASAPKQEEIVRLLEVADSLHSVGRTDSAAVVGKSAIELARDYGDPMLIVGAHSTQGVYLRSLGRIDEALESYDRALEIVTSEQFRENPGQDAIEEIASLYINLAVLNLDMQNKADAVRNAELSGEWIEKSEDPELRGTIFGVVGSVLTGCGELEKAGKYQALAYRDAIEAKNDDAAFRAAAYGMLVADRTGNKNEAQAWRERCQTLLPEISAMMTKMVYYQAETSICLKNKDNQGVISWFDKILNLEGIENLPFVRFDCYNNMHVAYAGLGDYRKAYETLLESNGLRDTLWHQEKDDSLRELTVKYETKETQLALAQSEARRSRTLMWLFAAAGLLVIVVAGFIVYAGRQRRRRMQREVEFANLKADVGRQLTQQYVEGLENERSRMSRELHDGVCNDLLAIQMQLSNGQSVESTARLVESCRESVRRISHELLPPEFSYTTLDEVVKFFVAKQAEAHCDKINITYHSSATGAGWGEVADDMALEVYRIIQESVGNAVKHSGAKDIHVELVLNNMVLDATISDNGTYKSTSRKGVGLESIRRRAKAIDGRLTINNHDSMGTEVHLHVKI